MDRRMNGQTNEWTDRWTSFIHNLDLLIID